MSAEQKRIIEDQQKTIQKLERELSRIRQITQTTIEVGVGDIGNHLSDLLNYAQPAAIKRFGYREAFIVPAAVLEGRCA